MRQGGYLTLINSTYTDWHLKHYHYYQMNDWSFPAIIKAGDAARIYIEWNEGLFKFKADDAWEAIYELFGTGRQFEIQARAAPYRIQIYYNAIEAIGKPRGFTQILGWRQNGVITFVLTERGGLYNAICSWDLLYQKKVRVIST